MGVIGDFIKKIGNGLGNWFTGVTGSGLTAAQKEANQFSAQQAEISREWDEKMYQQYNSPSALVRQYQSAGINPALMFGGSTPAAPQASGVASSVSPSTPGFDMLTALASLANVKADIDLKKSETDKNDSQTELNRIDAQFRATEKEYAIEESKSRINENLAAAKKALSDISVNDSTIEVNGFRIKLLSAQTDKETSETTLNGIKAAIANLDYEKAKVLLPYAEKVAKAELALTEAKTEEAIYAAQKSWSAANVDFLNIAKEQKLIDEGYYDYLTATAKRRYKWIPVQETVSALAKTASAAAGVALSLSGAGLIGKAAGAAVTSIGSQLGDSFLP